MASYLVTGGAGFIGSHLVDSLVEDGHSVRVIDDLSTGRIENVSPGAELMVGDIADPQALARATEDISGCFHLAAIASVERCREEWFRSHTVNLGGSIALFESLARRRREDGLRARIVYASSAAIYGNHPQGPIFEDSIARPINVYGVDKLACELHAEVGHQLHHLDCIGLRFFNVYGPRQDPSSPYSGVISIFCERIRKRLPIEIYGDGAQLRDFIYVSDVVAAIRLAMDARQTCSRIFNVCTGEATSIGRLGEMIADIQGVSFSPAYRAERAGDIRSSVGNPNRAEKCLKFRAQTALRLGLTHTLSALERVPQPKLREQL